MPGFKLSGAIALVLCFLAVGTQAQTFVALLDAANQVPPMTAKQVNGATGHFHLNIDGDVASWTLEVENIVNMTMAHIHIGNASENGNPLVIILPLGEGMDGGSLPMLAEPETGDFEISGNFTADAFLAANWTMDMLAEESALEQLYVNIHTVEFPPGAIRGQLMLGDDDDAMSPMGAEAGEAEAGEAEAGEAEAGEAEAEAGAPPAMMAPYSAGFATAPLGKAAGVLLAAVAAAALF